MPKLCANCQQPIRNKKATAKFCSKWCSSRVKCEKCGVWLMKSQRNGYGLCELCEIDRQAHKRCLICAIACPIEAFSKDSGAKDARRSYCRDCDAERVAQRREKDRNRAKRFNEPNPYTPEEEERVIRDCAAWLKEQHRKRLDEL